MPVTPSDSTEQQYQQGFNDGYLLSKYRPDISDSLNDLQPLSPRLEGMIDGREQFQIEKAKSKEIVQEKNNSPIKKKKDRDREID